MADLNLDYQNTDNADDAYNVTKEHLTPDFLKEFKASADFTYDDNKKVIKGKGKGFSFDATFLESELELNLKLSLMFKPFKGKVIQILAKELKKVL